MTGGGCRILAVSTHPDDVELACGGSLILAARQGMAVAIADLTAGEAATRGTAPERRAEALEAARRLGVTQRVCLGLPDTRLADSEAHAAPLAGLIRALKPEIMLIPFASDKHPDHVAAAALCRRAIFLARLASHGTGLPHAVSRIAAYPGHHPMEPSLVVDVSAVWPERMHALRAHRSQFEGGGSAATPLSTGEFLRFIEARAICHGALIGVAYGEAFRLDGPVAAAGLDVLSSWPSAGYRRFL